MTDAASTHDVLDLIAPSKRAVVRFFHKPTKRIVGFAAKSAQQVVETGASSHDIAVRIARWDPGTFNGPRRFAGADGVKVHAAPWKKGWHVISVRREYGPALPTRGADEPDDPNAPRE